MRTRVVVRSLCVTLLAIAACGRGTRAPRGPATPAMEQAAAAFADTGIRFEVIVIDDGSEDDT